MMPPMTKSCSTSSPQLSAARGVDAACASQHGQAETHRQAARDQHRQQRELCGDGVGAENLEAQHAADDQALALEHGIEKHGVDGERPARLPQPAVNAGIEGDPVAARGEEMRQQHCRPRPGSAVPRQRLQRPAARRRWSPLQGLQGRCRSRWWSSNPDAAACCADGSRDG